MIRSYEDYKSPNEAPVTPPKTQFWNGNQKHFSKTPSQLHLWYEQENIKRSQGLLNEIDVNEIKAAQKGVKNKWFSKVITHPQLFSDVDNLNWKSIKAI
jgi:hypothetical protein